MFRKDITDAKLSVLMDEFKAFMEEHDLGGVVVIHHKDETAFYTNMAPKYSITKEVKDIDNTVIGYSFSTKGLPDDLKTQKTEATCNMFKGVSMVMMQIGVNLADASDRLDKSAQAFYTDPD